MATQSPTLLAATLFTLLSAVAPQALAASAADLTVSGSLRPASCDINFSGGNEFNFGVISVDNLNPAGEDTVLVQKKTLTITCDAPTNFYLVAPFDNGGQLKNHGAASDKATGHLAWTVTGVTPQENVCDRSVLPEQVPKTDNGDGTLRQAGKQYVRIRANRPTTMLSCNDGAYFNNVFGLTDGFTDGTYATPALLDVDGGPFIKRTVIPVGLMATINPRETLETAADIMLEGSAVLTIIYI